MQKINEVFRLLRELQEAGYESVCCIRNTKQSSTWFSERDRTDADEIAHEFFQIVRSSIRVKL